MVGFGPGAHSGAEGPFQATEAHNLILDILLQGGVIGLGAFGMMVLQVVWAAVSQRQYLMVGLLTAVLVTGLAGNLLRQPVFWIFIWLPQVFRAWEVKALVRNQGTRS